MTITITEPLDPTFSKVHCSPMSYKFRNTNWYSPPGAVPLQKACGKSQMCFLLITNTLHAESQHVREKARPSGTFLHICNFLHKDAFKHEGSP